jgi:hypothetical protein
MIHIEDLKYGYDGSCSIRYSIFRIDKDGQSNEIILNVYGRSYLRTKLLFQNLNADEHGVQLISVYDDSGTDWINELTKDEYDDIVFKLDEAVIRNIKDFEQSTVMGDYYYSYYENNDKLSFI